MNSEDFSAISAGVSAFAASLAAVFAWYSHMTARRALRLAERQDSRGEPRLMLSLINGYLKADRANGKRNYAFFLSVSNDSDRDNSGIDLELCISYLTSENILITVKLRAQDKPDEAFGFGSDCFLTMPMNIAAHATVSGWCYFVAEEGLLNDIKIDGYRIELTDGYRNRTDVQPGIIQEYRDEN
jgi:hypothetical protein